MQRRLLIIKIHFILLSLLLFSCVPQTENHKAELQIPKVKVHLVSISKIDSIMFDGTFIMESEEATYEFGRNNRKVFIEIVPKGIKIFNDNRLFVFGKNDQISFLPENESSLFLYHDNKYSGKAKLIPADSLRFYLINELDVESYLKGVVPAEIFTNDAVFSEAIKAQAVCARSYVLKKIESNSTKPFHVYANIQDQAYGGSGIRTRLGDSAVDETLGSILMYKKDIAETFYHASCGGVLEDAAHVWPGFDKSYLKSRQDVVGNNFADIESPYYRWVEERTPKQLDTLFNYNFDISHLDDAVQDTMDIPFIVQVNERYPSGRIKNMAVQYGSERKELANYEIRKFFGWPPGKLLKSTLINFSSSDSTLVINGAGNGHGVGMCQFGAIYKAKNGLQYYHILQSYFPGTTLKKIY